jgi:hypothetical protein
MNRPKNPTEKRERKRNKPSSTTREHHEEFQRTSPGRRTPGVEKGRERIVNEDEQLKDVNYREDNAQSPAQNLSDQNPPAAPQENENERTEAPNDNNEVHPRPPKVN